MLQPCGKTCRECVNEEVTSWCVQLPPTKESLPPPPGEAKNSAVDCRTKLNLQLWGFLIIIYIYFLHFKFF